MGNLRLLGRTQAELIYVTDPVDFISADLKFSRLNVNGTSGHLFYRIDEYGHDWLIRSNEALKARLNGDLVYDLGEVGEEIRYITIQPYKKVTPEVVHDEFLFFRIYTSIAEASMTLDSTSLQSELFITHSSEGEIEAQWALEDFYILKSHGLVVGKIPSSLVGKPARVEINLVPLF